MLDDPCQWDGIDTPKEVVESAALIKCEGAVVKMGGEGSCMDRKEIYGVLCVSTAGDMGRCSAGRSREKSAECRVMQKQKQRQKQQREGRVKREEEGE